MAKIFLLHWHQVEAEERAAGLRDAGHTVVLHWNTEAGAPLKDSLPDITVISLDRLPSHGRAVAEWLWEAKKRRHIPIIFAGGETAKVAATRTKFPAAVFCPTEALVDMVAEVTRAHTIGAGPTVRLQSSGAGKKAPTKSARRTGPRK